MAFAHAYSMSKAALNNHTQALALGRSSSIIKAVIGWKIGSENVTKQDKHKTFLPNEWFLWSSIGVCWPNSRTRTEGCTGQCCGVSILFQKSVSFSLGMTFFLSFFFAYGSFSFHHAGLLSWTLRCCQDLTVKHHRKLFPWYATIESVLQLAQMCTLNQLLFYRNRLFLGFLWRLVNESVQEHWSSRSMPFFSLVSDLCCGRKGEPAWKDLWTSGCGTSRGFSRIWLGGVYQRRHIPCGRGTQPHISPAAILDWMTNLWRSWTTDFLEQKRHISHATFLAVVDCFSQSICRARLLRIWAQTWLANGCASTKKHNFKISANSTSVFIAVDVVHFVCFLYLMSEIHALISFQVPGFAGCSIHV